MMKMMKIFLLLKEYNIFILILKLMRISCWINKKELKLIQIKILNQIKNSKIINLKDNLLTLIFREFQICLMVFLEVKICNLLYKLLNKSLTLNNSQDSSSLRTRFSEEWIIFSIFLEYLPHLGKDSLSKALISLALNNSLFSVELNLSKISWIKLLNSLCSQL